MPVSDPDTSTQLAQQRTDLAETRTQWAAYRTYWAADRTLNAWLRAEALPLGAMLSVVLLILGVWAALHVGW